MSKYYTVEKANTIGNTKICMYNGYGNCTGQVIQSDYNVEGYCSCLEYFGYERKEIEKPVDITFKAKGYVYENAKCIGITLDNGFTLQMQDKDGNVIPLNKEAIESFVKEKE